MNRLKYLVIGILALILAGCGRGQIVVESLNVAGNPTANAQGNGKSIVILPFADYSQGNIDSALRRNMIVTETLTDHLILKGFDLPVQEDVVDYLIDENIIGVNTSPMARELSNDWSNAMKDEIRSYMSQIETQAAEGTGNSPGTHGLTTQTVTKIGRHFKADYIIRGRILEFKTRQGTIWAPSTKGFLPFVLGTTGKTVFGIANVGAYDDRDDALNGISHASDLTHGRGDVDTEGTVQIRMWVQEAATGTVVWSNRVRVQVAPESVLADNQYDSLFDTAIEKGIKVLVNNFVDYTL